MAGTQDNRPTEVIETSIEREMRETKAHQQAMALEFEKTARVTAEARSRVRVARARAWGYAGIALVVCAMIVGVSWIVWQANAGPSDKDQRYQEQYKACVVDKNGTWIPPATEHGPICVANGKAEEK